MAIKALSFIHLPNRLPPMLIPLGLSVIVLAALNLGLNTRLAPQQPFAPYQVPFAEDFANPAIEKWFRFGGDWQGREGQLAQVKTDPGAASIFVPLWLTNTDSYDISVRLSSPAGAKTTGISFNAQYPNLRQSRHVIEIIPQDGQWVLVCGYYQNSTEIRTQAAVPLERPSDQPLDVRVKISTNSTRYAVSIDDQPLVADIPVVFRDGLVGLHTLDTVASFDDLTITPPGTADASAQPTPEPTPQPALALPDTDGVIFSSQFSGTLEGSGWVPFSGDWAFADSTLVQRQTDGFDLGILYEEQYGEYQVRTSFRHDQGVGAGLLFNAPQPDSKNGAHMVRYTDDASGLFWGFFDNDGVFVGQGYAATGSPGTDTHVLSVASGADTYSINLDGQTIAQDIPLNTTAGHIGLIASQTAARFDQVEVTTLDGAGTAPPAPAADLLQELETITGEWQREGTAIRQVTAETTDYITGIGILAEQYTLEVGITLPADSEIAGGGVIFHMPQRDSLNSAYMVRFGDGGKQIFWGRYSDQGQFNGIGAAEVSVTPGIAAEMVLTVRSSNFSIAVDGQIVADNIPLDVQSGWIGLISYSGPVLFNDLRVTLGEASS